ncbi:alpha/beta fold hydrolase [Nocardia sp. NPDC058176]|uniref:alpha/beta fold hydrolase n=1 Tax=Nocardia sp. NPDC058176 TaxID=3346368 RepID=UPI0036DD3E96
MIAVAPTVRSIGGLVIHGYGTESVGHPVVVLLHGIGGSAESCAPVARLLAESGLAVWCVDAAGYGDSADPGPDHDVVGDALRVLDAVSPDRPAVLFGTSWGGVVAMSAALRRPDRVAALVLADSTRGSGTDGAKATAMRARIAELAEHGGEFVAAARAPRLTGPNADPDVVAAVHASMHALRLSGFAAAAEFMASTDLGPHLGEIACPTLVLVGEHDIVTGVEESRLLAEHIAGARRDVTVGARHQVTTDTQHHAIAGTQHEVTTDARRQLTTDARRQLTTDTGRQVTADARHHVIADAGHVAIQEQPQLVAELVVRFVGELS